MTTQKRVWQVMIAAICVLCAGSATAIHAQAPGRPGDRITVHGHWTIDIQNADGQLAAHHEFENALEPSGAAALAGLLGRQFQPSTWRLELVGANSAGACVRLAPAGTVTVAPLDPAPGPFAGNGQPYFYSEFVVSGPATMWIPVITPLGHERPTFDVAEVDAANAPPGFRLASYLGNGGPGVQFATFEWDRNAAPGQYVFHLQISGATVGSASLYLVSMTIAPPTDADQSSGSYPCSAVESGSLIPGDLDHAWFPTLELAVVEAADGRQNLEITGNIHATNGQAIEQVRSVIVLSSSAVLPFSSRVLATPIQVATGQTVYIKVVLSFS